MSDPIAIVMAAGKGTRMKSALPKVLVEVCGRPMIEYVLDALDRGGVHRKIVVVGYQAQAVRDHLTRNGFADGTALSFVEQREQLGTGHAVMMCRDELASHEGAVLVVAGDSPLMQSESIRALLDEFERSQPACLLGTGYRDDPTGFGRIQRDDRGEFLEIVEERDASPRQRQIREVNLSCYVFNCADLLPALQQLKNKNSQGEYYLTDVPGILQSQGKRVRALDVLKPCEALSINTLDDLAVVEEELKATHGIVSRERRPRDE